MDALLDYRLVTGGFLTVTLPGVAETGGTLLSLVIGIIALFGFHLLQRVGNPTRARVSVPDVPTFNDLG